MVSIALVYAICQEPETLTEIKAPGRLAGDSLTVSMSCPSTTQEVPAAASRPETGFDAPRLAREWQTVSALIECYCRGHHHPPRGKLCAECQSLSDYAHLRLERCRFGAEKPTCAKCPVHCYQRTRREEIRAVMIYAGPRMLWQHPWLSLRHWLDSRRPAPPLQGSSNGCGATTPRN